MDENNNNQAIAIYQSEDGSIQLDVTMQDETVWLTVNQMAMLFDRDRTVITRHINKIFAEGELDKTLVCAKNTHPKKYGRREGFNNATIFHYNTPPKLDTRF